MQEKNFIFRYKAHLSVITIAYFLFWYSVVLMYSDKMQTQNFLGFILVILSGFLMIFLYIVQRAYREYRILVRGTFAEGAVFVRTEDTYVSGMRHYLVFYIPELGEVMSLFSYQVNPYKKGDKENVYHSQGDFVILRKSFWKTDDEQIPNSKI